MNNCAFKIFSVAAACAVALSVCSGCTGKPEKNNQSVNDQSISSPVENPLENSDSDNTVADNTDNSTLIDGSEADAIDAPDNISTEDPDNQEKEHYLIENAVVISIDTNPESDKAYVSCCGKLYKDSDTISPFNFSIDADAFFEQINSCITIDADPTIIDIDYDGMIAESYPCQLGQVYTITVKSCDPIPDDEMNEYIKLFAWDD